MCGTTVVRCSAEGRRGRGTLLQHWPSSHGPPFFHNFALPSCRVLSARPTPPAAVSFLPAARCLQSPIRQVPPTFLSDRIPVISPDQSAALVGGMQQIGMLDAEGWLLGDPDTNKPASLVSEHPVAGQPAWHGACTAGRNAWDAGLHRVG